MNILGFNLTKIAANRSSKILPNPMMNTNIEFLDVVKEEIEMLKENDAVKITFKFSVDYTDSKEKDKKTPEIEGKVEFEGIIILSASKDEAKDIFKFWKKKQIPEGIRIPLFNVILRKCSPKALDMEDQIGLPLHLPFPQIQSSKKE